LGGRAVDAHQLERDAETRAVVEGDFQRTGLLVDGDLGGRGHGRKCRWPPGAGRPNALSGRKTRRPAGAVLDVKFFAVSQLRIILMCDLNLQRAAASGCGCWMMNSRSRRASARRRWRWWTA